MGIFNSVFHFRHIDVFPPFFHIDILYWVGFDRISGKYGILSGYNQNLGVVRVRGEKVLCKSVSGPILV